MPYSPARQQVIEQLGARSAEEAVRSVEAAHDTGAHPREKRALLAFLKGETVREVSAALGVSQGRTLQLIRRATREVIRMREAEDNARPLLEGLSNRSRRSLERAGLDTDEKVRRVVELYGARGLTTLEVFGVHQHAEVCAAFGFDPDEPIRFPGLSDREVRALSAPPYGRRAHRIRDIILADERIFPEGPEADPEPEHQPYDTSGEAPSP